jgi:hypothetical protein
MLKELRLCEVLCIAGMISACAGSDLPLETAEISNIGLSAAVGVPPLGEGIAPISGRGGDGAPVVVAIGGWSGGPGAVKWHGGQWVVPYSAHPGASLMNASCDVVPRADASALVELVSSNGQVLGSSTVPATTANVVIRTWPFVGSHPVVDDEQVVMRVSPRDALTGAWTSEAQDMTIISCAVRTVAFVPRAIGEGAVLQTFAPALASVSVPGGGDPGPMREPFHNSFVRPTGGATAGKVYQPLLVSSGNTLRSWSQHIIKSSDTTLTAKLFRASFEISVQVGATQTISNSPGLTAIGQIGLSENVDGMSYYYVEIASPGSGQGHGTDQTMELTATLDPTGN